jgi:hypothetical protein
MCRACTPYLFRVEALFCTLKRVGRQSWLSRLQERELVMHISVSMGIIQVDLGTLIPPSLPVILHASLHCCVYHERDFCSVARRSYNCSDHGDIDRTTAATMVTLIVQLQRPW